MVSRISAARVQVQGVRKTRRWSKIDPAMATPKKQPSILSNPPEEEFHPRTPLGRRLWEIRKRIVESGEPLLDREGLEREIAERRGGAAGRSR